MNFYIFKNHFQKISKLNVKDICVSIKIGEILDFSQIQFKNLNKTLTFIDTWIPPFIYTNINQVCGPLIQILEKLCQRYGYK